ncbi:MAG: hypothetical protein KF882_01810 [Bacteroidia bacterium]|nr:hypothetical protein [Bacteroidia bacterium]MCO5253981.1 hypothetical protein [Bacteroidota bacterium]
MLAAGYAQRASVSKDEQGMLRYTFVRSNKSTQHDIRRGVLLGAAKPLSIQRRIVILSARGRVCAEGECIEG